MKSLLSFVALFALCAAAVADPLVINQTGKGTQFGTQPTQGASFHGASPVPQRSGSAQTAVTKTTGAAIATTGSTNSSPYGFTTSAQADALVARVNQLVTDNANLVILVNELRAALVEKGLIKGQ